VHKTFIFLPEAKKEEKKMGKNLKIKKNITRDVLEF
jgi:hypothetical protein